MSWSINKLTEREILEIIRLLEAADKNHRDWLSQLHVSMICKQPFDEDVFHENAHRCCQFGQWYYRQAPGILQELDAFQSLEPLHKHMHDAARHLANVYNGNTDVCITDYHSFIEKQREFLAALLGLRDKLCESFYSFDALTGLMTREPFSRILDAELSRMRRTGDPCCLALIDVDFFKSVNDLYGHLIGDHVLSNVAQFILTNLRPYDSVCRYGGEEFLIALPDTSLEKAFDVIDRLRKKIEIHAIDLDHKTISVSVSAGIALLTDAGYENCLNEADKALYRAKHAGRNQVRVSE